MDSKYYLEINQIISSFEEDISKSNKIKDRLVAKARAIDSFKLVQGPKTQEQINQEFRFFANKIQTTALKIHK